MVIRRGEIWWASLPSDSVASVSQVVTADKRFLTERVGVVAPDLLVAIEHGLRLILRL